MRLSNVELCRIVAILMVMIVHSSFATFGSPVGWEKPHFGLILAQSMCIVGVNLFILISGYFSIKLTARSVWKLFYCCLFYALVAILYSYYTNTFSLYQLLFISEANWFISVYIGLMLISPILNAFIDCCDRKSLGNTILALLLFQTWYEFVPKFLSDFHGGYSIISFCVIYIIARYLRLYPLNCINLKKCIFTYLIITFFIAMTIYYDTIINFKTKTIIEGMLKYNNPLVILASVSLFGAFLKLDIGYSCIINYIAKSCLAILLLHTSIVFFPYYSELFKYIFYSTSGIITLICWVIAILGISLICIAVDQIRIIIENRLFFKK